jgi:hypothetical protein
MNACIQTLHEARRDTAGYARFINATGDASWEIDRDVLLDRTLNFRHKFLPDGLSRVDELAFLTESEGRSLSRVQGRTYAFLFGFVERLIGATIRDPSRGHCLGDQASLEALVHFGAAELKQQELFGHVEALIAGGMPGGYSTVANLNELARVVLSKSSWAALALSLHIELLVQSHYEHSLDQDVSLSPLFKDIFRLHWHETSRRVIRDELEWREVDARLTPEERDVAVSDLADLFDMVDRIVQAQAALDSAFFLRLCDRNFTDDDQRAIRALMVKAYRWQYIVSGVHHRSFRRLLTELTTTAQMQRLQRALVPILNGGR